MLGYQNVLRLQKHKFHEFVISVKVEIDPFLCVSPILTVYTCRVRNVEEFVQQAGEVLYFTIGQQMYMVLLHIMSAANEFSQHYRLQARAYEECDMLKCTTVYIKLLPCKTSFNHNIAYNVYKKVKMFYFF